ncbi:PLDc N-terminal domain-containing protein [Prescottella defluvii]|nr:PLDc N-terminal domain-containing protein [Prescottella defluvii]
MEEHTAQLPLAYDITWTVFAVLWLALVIATTVSVLRARHASGAAKIAWILLVVALPILGSLAWFTLGSKPAERSGPGPS